METVYNKLVRDKIPKIIEDAGKTPVFRQENDRAELHKFFIEKLEEELEEYQNSHALEELVDMLEVIYGLAETIHTVSREELEEKRTDKQEKRGKFKKQYILEKVTG